MVLRKSFYIRWSAGRSPRVHEVNPGRDPSAGVLAFDGNWMTGPVGGLHLDGLQYSSCRLCRLPPLISANNLINKK